MLYIEQIPRKESEPFYTTELTDIEDIRAWIRQHCDITKRHVISSARRGPIVAEGIQQILYFGWDPYKKHPLKVVANQMKTVHDGFKAFIRPQDATAHYQECKRIAQAKLEKDAVLARAMLQQLETQAVSIGAYANPDEQDYGGELCVYHRIDGFHFHKEI